TECADLLDAPKGGQLVETQCFADTTDAATATDRGDDAPPLVVDLDHRAGQFGTQREPRVERGHNGLDRATSGEHRLGLVEHRLDLARDHTGRCHRAGLEYERTALEAQQV